MKEIIVWQNDHRYTGAVTSFGGILEYVNHSKFICSDKSLFIFISCDQLHFHLHGVPQVQNDFSVTCAKELSTNVHQLWQKHFCSSNELKCCVQSKFLLCYYCVNDSRSAAQRHPQTKVACTLRLDG